MLGYQPNKFPASLVTRNKTRSSFVFVTGDFILYLISVCIASIFLLGSPAILKCILFCLEIKLLLYLTIPY